MSPHFCAYQRRYYSASWGCFRRLWSSFSTCILDFYLRGRATSTHFGLLNPYHHDTGLCWFLSMQLFNGSHCCVSLKFKRGLFMLLNSFSYRLLMLLLLGLAPAHRAAMAELLRRLSVLAKLQETRACSILAFLPDLNY